MSYPKKTASMAGSQYGGTFNGLSSSQTNVDVKAIKRREQLHTLLVNKFRGKYCVDMAEEENAMDRLIRAEVARFLETDQMTEANLIKLDKRLAEMIGKQSGVPTGRSQGIGSRGSNPSRQAYNDTSS